MELSEVASIVAALASLFAIWRASSDKRFDEIKDDIRNLREEMKEDFQEVRRDIREMREDISDLKERVSGLEVTAMFIQINGIPENARSAAAKKMWESRKNKRIHSKVEVEED